MNVRVNNVFESELKNSQYTPSYGYVGLVLDFSILPFIQYPQVYFYQHKNSSHIASLNSFPCTLFIFKVKINTTYSWLLPLC
jgi:hypothetical protein